MTVKVKICGIKNADDAQAACENGADSVGFVFVKETPRYVSKEEVSGILKCISSPIRERVFFTGLFKDDSLESIVSIVSGCGLDRVQLQGTESPADCEFIKKKTGASIMKVFKVYDSVLPNGRYMPGDYEAADYFVFDTFHPYMSGGTGLRFDWDALVKAKPGLLKPFFLAGGLNPSNVAAAVRTVGPHGVDVSSGVEEFPGKKDIKLLKEFIKNAKEVKNSG
jgi:phosphoribosylanthranilate isomerase